MPNEAMFLDPDPKPPGQEAEEWQPSREERRQSVSTPDDTAFGFYRPATNGKRGRYAE
jgi:hypothetical protein